MQELNWEMRCWAVGCEAVAGEVGAGDVVMVKGSYGSKMSVVVEALRRLAIAKQ